MRSSAALVAVLAGVTLLSTAACSSSPSAQELEQAREAGASQAREEAAREAEVERLREKVEDLKQQSQADRAKARKAAERAEKAENQATSGSGSSNSGALSGPETQCADNVYAGAKTSCSFAMNVAGEYGSNPDAASISAYSPVTEQSYTLSCSGYAGGGTVCISNTGASIYIL
ncbi:MAG: hypothetical protein KDC39_05540 [Actinobacteria bacterium]|nr:hypothetical protein [Actinomycetota bacterium]